MNVAVKPRLVEDDDEVKRRFEAADNVNRAKAVGLTIWLALGSPDIDNSDDREAIRESVYQVVRLLEQAEKTLGVYK